MVWVKLDDGFPEHPKMHAAGPLGLAMQVAALCYSNRHLTDGFVPTAAAKKLIDLDDIRGVAWRGVVNRLVDVGAWLEVEGGWRIHDYAEYQPTKAHVEAERERKRAAGRKGGLAKARRRVEQLADTKQDAKHGAKHMGYRNSATPVPVPTASKEAVRARTRDPTPNQPPVFNGDAHEARLRAQESDEQTAKAALDDIRRTIKPASEP